MVYSSLHLFIPDLQYCCECFLLTTCHLLSYCTIYPISIIIEIHMHIHLLFCLLLHHIDIIHALLPANIPPSILACDSRLRDYGPSFALPSASLFSLIYCSANPSAALCVHSLRLQPSFVLFKFSMQHSRLLLVDGLRTLV